MIAQRRLLVVSLSLAFAAVVPQAASAQVAGEDQGVTAARGHHGAVLRFSKRAAPVYRKIAGRRVVIGCGTVTRDLGGYSIEGETTGVIKAPRRRGTLTTLAAG